MIVRQMFIYRISHAAPWKKFPQEYLDFNIKRFYSAFF